MAAQCRSMYDLAYKARLEYETGMTAATKTTERLIKDAQQRLKAKQDELQRQYEVAVQHAYEAHGDAPLSPRDNANVFFHKQLNQLQRQQGILHDRIVALEQQTVSPRTVQRLKDTYATQTVISPQTQKELKDAYDAQMDRNISVVADLETPPNSPQSQEETPERGLVQMRGYVNADGRYEPLSQCKKVLFAEPEPDDALSPDPQLCAEGGSGEDGSAGA